MPMTMLDVEHKLDNISSLPTLPVIAANLLEKLKNHSISMQHISTIMENDPAITTKVLKVANSAYYSLRNRVDTIRMALVVLGVNEVTNIILGLSIFKAFDEATSHERFDLKDFWRQSILTSQIARYLAKTLHIKTHGEEFTGGLIHGIGKLILFIYFQKEFLETLDAAKINREDLYLTEKRLLGVSHMEVGSWLAGKWRLPGNLVDCIRFYHQPTASLSYTELVSLINIGDYYASRYLKKALDDDFSEFRTVPGWEVLKAQRYLIDVKNFYSDLEQESRKAEDFAHNILMV